MSLIIANTKDENCLLISDLKISYDDIAKVIIIKNNKAIEVNPEHFENGQIKFQIIRENVVVAFAGDTNFASKAYSHLNENNNLDIEQIKTYLKQVARESFGETDFLILYTLDGVNHVIEKIKNGPNERNKSEMFIGDASAYTKYKELNDKEFINSSVFSDILHDENFTTVGGIYITLEYYDGRYIIRSYNTTYGGKPIIAEKAKKTSLLRNNTADGDFSYITYETGKNVFAMFIYINSSGLGLIFKQDEEFLMTFSEYVKNVNSKSFCEILKYKYGDDFSALIHYSLDSIQEIKTLIKEHNDMLLIKDGFVDDNFDILNIKAQVLKESIYEIFKKNNLKNIEEWIESKDPYMIYIIEGLCFIEYVNLANKIIKKNIGKELGIKQFEDFVLNNNIKKIKELEKSINNIRDLFKFRVKA